MDRMQALLKVAMSVLEIPVTSENYRLICNAVYIARKSGVELTTQKLCYDEKKKLAYSPPRHQCDGSSPYPTTLYDDVVIIEKDVKAGLDDSAGCTLDSELTEKLKSLKRDIETFGIERLLEKLSQ